MATLPLPYLMSRQEWQDAKEKNKIDSNPIYKGHQKNGRKGDLANLSNLENLCYGVGKWLHEKALAGCKDSLEKIEYGYDIYSEVINKAREEGKL